MDFPEFKNHILEDQRVQFNGQYGKLSFWAGTMPTNAQLLEQDPSLITASAGAASLRNALEALGCTLVQITEFKNLQVTGKGDETTFHFPDAEVRGQVSYGTTTPTFAMFHMGMQDDWWSNAERIDMVFTGSVGLIGSGADLELTSLDLGSNVDINIGRFKYTLN